MNPYDCNEAANMVQEFFYFLGFTKEEKLDQRSSLQQGFFGIRPSCKLINTDDDIPYEILAIMKEIQQKEREREEEKGIETDWMLVASVIDRFLFTVFTILASASTFMILFSHPSYSDDINIEI